MPMHLCLVLKSSNSYKGKVKYHLYSEFLSACHLRHVLSRQAALHLNFISDLNCDINLIQMSEALLSKGKGLANSLITHLWLPSTSKKYFYAVKDFLFFCNWHRISHNLIMPVSEDVLCLYVATMAGSVAGHTISNKLLGLQSWHIQHNKLFSSSLQLKHTV